MNKVLLFFLVCFLATNAFAQTSEGTAVKVWTLKECVDYALANNLDVQRSQYNVESAEINRIQAKAAMWPTLNASGANGYNWGRPLDPTTNQFVTQNVTSLSTSLNSSVTLYNGSRIQNTIKQNSRDYSASEQDLLKSRNDVSLNVVNLYINVIFNKELLENAKLQLSSSQQQLERTRKQVAAGALPRSDELNLDAQVATNELNVINNENTLNLSLLQLKQALLLPAATAMDVEAPEVAIEDLVLDQSSEQIFDIAKQSLPEVRSADLKVESASYAVRAAKGNLYPRLSLGGSISSNYSSTRDGRRFIPDGDSIDVESQIGYWKSGIPPTPVYRTVRMPTGTEVNKYGYRDQLSDNVAQSLNVSVTIPIFNGLQAKMGVRRAIVSQRIAEISQKQVHQTLRQNVETAYNDAFAASKSYNSSLRQVQAREEAYRITKQRFDIGASNYVEYQVAENELFRAKSDLARAKYNFIFRKKLLDFYQGKPLGF